MNEKETLGRRKEPRFKTADEQALHCDCFYHEDDPKQGSIIDISAGGLRLLCDGDFCVGQAILIELKTDQSHGAFGGVIRRVEPWVGGQCLLGCQLLETIPDDVLEALAQEGIVNRRRDDRVDWNRPAKMSWQLQPGEVDIEIQDCSLDGLKVTSKVAIPDHVRLRIRVDIDDEEQVVIDAKTVWQTQQDDQCVAGLAFNNREAPEAVTQVVAQGNTNEVSVQPKKRTPSIRPSILIAATIVVVGVRLMQAGLLP